MIPEHRLANLLQQVKQWQMSKCLWHNTNTSPSLYSDHMCDKSQFPLRTLKELDDHTDEVWFVEFSHDGHQLATTGKDKTVVIYDTSTFEVLQTLSHHTGPVATVAWSPDDTKIVSCSHDNKARLWDSKVSSPICFSFTFL
jgi:WD40 repeat protein